IESSSWSTLEVLGVGGSGEATRGGLFRVLFPSGDSWPTGTQQQMQFQGQGPWCLGLWTTPGHSHCMPHTRAVDHAGPQQLHAPDRGCGPQHLTTTHPALSLPRPPWLHSMPHVRGTILSKTSPWLPTVAGLQWLWLEERGHTHSQQNMLSSSLALHGRGMYTLGRGGCTLTLPSSDLFD
uniref:Uncharacterized protein n=1 Tax=Aotus nancymaae TaxID=37293 RepID=A0A2K5CTV1_AOTNA